MQIVRFSVSAVITIVLIYLLNNEWNVGGKPIPPIGKLLSPQHGFWQNADDVEKDYAADLQFPQLKDKGEVYFDDRMVPHVFVQNEVDAYFIQGYLHAKFRLWQMEFQVYAAAGRISELIGEKAINYDKDKRRLGMIYAAEKAVAEMEKDSVTKSECDAYTAGINAYIENMKASELPVEYKLLNYQPEKWSNLKTALFLKYMSFELAGSESDFENTNAKTVFGLSNFEKMYPYMLDSLDPIIPKGTVYPAPTLNVKIPTSADSLYFNRKDSVGFVTDKPDKDNGSNNWAVSGKKTKSGKPILCNDPHLGLNLPSLWYEMQITTPNFNAYGVSFPGSPGIIIGFNDSCAFGVTNAERDVRDYYEIKFRDESMKEYWFNNEWKMSDFRYEHIAIKNKPEIIDTVAYTVFGPVMYDKTYNGNGRTNGKYYAVRWKAHDASNELMTFNLLNRAKNYKDYAEAIKYMHVPGQNFVFACKNGDIAIWDQGEFPAKWKRQGDFVMPGIDSTYMWQGNIPQSENPHMINPERGFVSSANQMPADPATYPYYLDGSFPPYRGFIINRKLSQMNDITPEDMMKLQTDNYNVFAEMAVPLFKKFMNENALDENEKKYFDTLINWNYRNDIHEKGATVFTIAWDYFEREVWLDDMNSSKLKLDHPVSSTTLEAVLKDSNLIFLDNINTPQKETLRDDITASFKKAAAVIKNAEAEGRFNWEKYKDTKVTHLAKLAPFSRLHLPIGGGTFSINATKEDHGPSWRMIVSLTDTTQAYGVYPGGQSGNPGSPFYDTFIDNWVEGKYYPLWVMNKTEAADKRIKYKMTFNK